MEAWEAALAVAAAIVLAWGVGGIVSRRAAERVRDAALRAEDLANRLVAVEADQRLRELVLTSMEDGVLLFARDGELAIANPAAERHLGTPPGSASTLTPPALRDAVLAVAGPSTAGPIEVEVEVGSPARWLRGSAARVGDEGATLLVLRDVTEARRIDAVRRDFVANASHELKSPAAAIQAAAETIRLASGDDPSVIPRFAEQLEREAVRLSRIVSDLLDLSRLESGSELGDRVRMDAVVREEIGRFEDAARSAGIRLAADVAETVPISGNVRDLALLVRNLIDNAIRYTPSGGRVDVAVAPEERGVLLRVRDTGAGIPSRDLPRIFERFYRVDRARSRETGGTGLGLSIVKHVIENHRGTITVQSELGRGTMVEVRLPAEPRSR